MNVPGVVQDDPQKIGLACDVTVLQVRMEDVGSRVVVQQIIHDSSLLFVRVLSDTRAAS